MTTSYTAPIKDESPARRFGFADFAARCARGIDFASAQRHEPLETPLREETLDPGLIENVRKAAIELEEATDRIDPEWARDWREHTTRTLEAQIRISRDMAHLRTRYEAMLADVDAWQPPTEMHTGLKVFMREQLIESIDVDCTPSTGTPGTYETAEDYRDAEIQRLTTDLSYHRFKLHKAQIHVAQQNDWIHHLWASLAAHPYAAIAPEDAEQD